MSYYLKHYDNNICEFEINDDINDIKVNLIKVNNLTSCPLDMTLDNDGIKKWLKRRIMPKNRAYAVNFLAKLGLNEKDTKGIIDLCMGLSLNDCYWITKDDFKGTFNEYNLYDNRFSNVLSLIAFTGYGSVVRSSFKSSPEFTTNGMLAKCWRRISGNIYLYKSGTEGFKNSGNEPYSEFYASQIADVMGIKAVNYNLAKFKSRLCSTCLLFTSKEYSYIPIANLIDNIDMDKVLSYYQELGDSYYNDLLDMLVFDAVILNTDRHFGNFGLMIDNRTNKIISTAPLFDHGLSLLNYMLEEDDINQYAQTRRPATYRDFIEILKGRITNNQKTKLKRLLNFKFKKHSKYNWSNNRLKRLETLIHQRVSLLLELN